MADGLTYKSAAWWQQKLKAWADGNLSEKEISVLKEEASKDPLYQIFADYSSPSLLAENERLANRLDQRLDQQYGVFFTGKGWIYGTMAASVVAIVFLFYLMSPSSKTPEYAERTVSSEEVYRPLTEQEALPHENPIPSTLTINDLTVKDNPNEIMQKAPIEEVSKENIEKKAEQVISEPVKEEKEKSQKTIQKTDNTRSFTQDPNRMIFLRVYDVSVMGKENLAAITSSGTNRTKDVTDPNIGGKVTTKTRTPDFSIDDMPYYTGGDQAFCGYLTRALNNRHSAKASEPVPSVVVQFTVEAKGKTSDVQVIGKVSPTLEAEIIKAVNNAPGWNAGRKSGKKGSLQYMVSIQFGH